MAQEAKGYLGIPTPDATSGNHTAKFADAAGQPEAHRAAMLVMKALAHAGLRVLDDDEFYSQVRSAYSTHAIFNLLTSHPDEEGV